MRYLLLLLLVCCLSMTAQTTTTVAQAVLGPDGLPATGSVTIQLSAPCRVGTNYVGERPVKVLFAAPVPPVAGVGTAVSVGLLPNDACVDIATNANDTTYLATWQMTNGSRWTETWLVPTSPTPVSFDSVVIHPSGPPPTPPFLIQWTQMGQNGAVIGDAPLWNGTVWLPGMPSGGVQTIFGRTGVVTAHTGDYTSAQVTENTNLYFTTARAIAALAGLYQTPITGAPGVWPSFATVATSGAYGDLTGAPTIPTTTTQISEGSNLYFTQARAIAALAGLYQSPITGAPGTWPSFATVATSGAYSDLTGAPAIPAPGSGTPAMDGTAAAGSSASYARADHVHPTDTTRQATISGAPGAWPSFATVATSGAYGDLTGAPTIPSTTTQISEGSNLYFTQARAIAALAGLYQSPITGAPGTWPSFASVATSGAYSDLTGKPTLATVATSGAYSDLTGKPTLATVATTGAYSDLSGKPALATVATSGAYGDLSGAPAIPSASSATPATDGTAAAGSSANYSRADHVHPYPIPAAAGCTVSANGQVCEDTTQAAFVGYANGIQAPFGRFIPAAGFSYTMFPSGDTVCALKTDAGCANAANATVQTAFLTTATIPANYLKAGKILKVTAGVKPLATATVPTEVVYLSLGATAICQTPTMSPSLTVLLGTTLYEWYVVVATAPSASASIYCNSIGMSFQNVNSAVSNSNSAAAQPATGIATNGSLVLSMALKYGAATTGNATTLNYLFVEELN